jgi:uncharacterized protein (DUF433 family)
MTTAQIMSDPHILCGKPCITGTRISVELVLEELGAGLSIDEFLAQYPHLTHEQVLASLRFAALALRPDPIPA